jgi:hypothetical protein
MKILLFLLATLQAITYSAQNDFKFSYDIYPIPKGILESISQTKTHLSDKTEEVENCNGLLIYYGKMEQLKRS